MKRLILGLLCSSLLVSLVFAQTLTSVQAMPLTLSQQFQNRIAFQMVLAAPAIETEAVAYTPPSGDTHPASGACHTRRAALAALVAQNPSTYIPIFVLHVVTSSSVTTAGALTGSGATLDTPATDAALFSAVNAVWSDTAGCITNP